MPKGYTSWNKGMTMSVDHCKKLSESHKGQVPSELHMKKFMKNCAGWNKGKKLSESHKKKLLPILKRNSILCKGLKRSEETKRKLSKAAIRAWSDPIIKEKTVRAVLKALQLKPNKSELKLFNILQELQPNNWQFVGDGKIIIEGFCPDFINVNGKKLIIELNGDYWHKNTQEKDKRKIEVYKSKGFKTLTVWEKELQNINEVKNRILKFSEVK
ncbi:MAG: DUF559 domain-containing protein [Candidatus Woesearchaeota archaeon]